MFKWISFIIKVDADVYMLLFIYGNAQFAMTIFPNLIFSDQLTKKNFVFSLK